MAFSGWTADALDFYDGLAADNSKTYWVAHKATYDEKVHAPMAALLDELEPEFGAGKIFRPYRDVRFSADKTPYKTTIAATLDKGGYVQLSADGLACGQGMYWMAPDQLARYRHAVDEDRTGKELESVIAAAARHKITITGHEQLKTAPRGFAKDHPRIGLLRNKGLVAWQEWPPAAWLGTKKAKDRVVAFLHASEPLAEWLRVHVGESR